MDKVLQELSQYRMEQAKRCIRSAKVLADDEDYKGAANRSYYAIFHCMRSVLALEEPAYVKRDIGYLFMADGYAPVEFGAKLDVSIDSDGYARIEKTSFPPLGGITTCPRGLYQTASRTGGTDYANNRI